MGDLLLHKQYWKSVHFVGEMKCEEAECGAKIKGWIQNGQSNRDEKQKKICNKIMEIKLYKLWVQHAECRYTYKESNIGLSLSQ